MTDKKPNATSTAIGILTALLTIGVLMIPAYVSYEVERQTVENVLNVEGLYINGTAIGTRVMNKTECELQWTNENVLGSFSNNDSYIYGTDGINRELYYGNWITYIGNGTYQINTNISDLAFGITPLGHRLGIPININGTTLAKFDFIRIEFTGQSYPHPLFFKYWSLFTPWLESGERLAFPIDNNEKPSTHKKILPLILVNIANFNEYTDFNGYPEYDLYIEFQSANNIPKSKEFGDGNFTIKIEGFTLTDVHQLSYDSETVYLGSVFGSILLMSTSGLFISKTIGIKIVKK